jgi:hypothetical protein
MFFQDLDNEEVYPHAGTLEEKAVFSLEQMRTRFWWEKKNYLQNRAGGARHTATLSAYGQRSADALAHHAETAFKNYLSQAYLTEDGETTDPKYPTDRMINSELRRVRGLIILNCSQYMEQFAEMMSENTDDWTRGIVYYNLYPYVNRYLQEAYDQISFVIPARKLAARTAAELEKEIDELSLKYSNPDNLKGLSRDYLIGRIRDELIDFLLNGLPFSNDRLQKKNEFGTKPLEEIAASAKEEEPKKVLH